VSLEREVKGIALSLLPPFSGAAAAADSEEDGAADAETPPAPKPERKVPLKGGLGDRERIN
jgi:small subunit ribosomal protein S1